MGVDDLVLIAVVVVQIDVVDVVDVVVDIVVHAEIGDLRRFLVVLPEFDGLPHQGQILLQIHHCLRRLPGHFGRFD